MEKGQIDDTFAGYVPVAKNSPKADPTESLQSSSISGDDFVGVDPFQGAPLNTGTKYSPKEPAKATSSTRSTAESSGATNHFNDPFQHNTFDIKKIYGGKDKKNNISPNAKGNNTPTVSEPFPKTIEEFGYSFNDKGELRSIKDGKPFEFNVSDDKALNQRRYEALGDAVTSYVYELLEKQGKLEKYPVPKDSSPQTFIFGSRDALSCDTLLLIINGSGVVRSGQWARRLIINKSLEKGSQLPYIARAKQAGFGILVLNTNEKLSLDGKPVKESCNAMQHASYVWQNYVSRAKAERIAIVAHSAGGSVAFDLYSKFAQDFESRVVAIALTDSAHGNARGNSQYLSVVARNWASSEKPLDSLLGNPAYVTTLSAGHSEHEMTSHAAIDSVFKFLHERVLAAKNVTDDRHFWTKAESDSSDIGDQDAKPLSSKSLKTTLTAPSVAKDETVVQSSGISKTYKTVGLVCLVAAVSIGFFLYKRSL